MNVILSIKPKYAEAILNGTKRCEFRKAQLPEDVDMVLIYSTNGVGKIVGWFTIKRQISGSPGDIWKSHSSIGGISKKDYDEYYRGNGKATCIEIKKMRKLRTPLDPFKNIEGFVAPQSFRYMKKADFEYLHQHIPELERHTMLRFTD